MDRTVAVTGGSGKLGRAVVTALVDDGWRVVNFDRVPSPQRDVPFIRTDFTDFGQVAEAFSGIDEVHGGVDAVVHLAAIPGATFAPNTTTFDNNLVSTFHVFQAAKLFKIHNLVWASSETLLGYPFHNPPAYVPLDEHVPPTPEVVYSLAKDLEEEMARQYCRWNPEQKMIGLRFSNVMDPSEYADFPAFEKDPASRKWNVWSYIDARDGAQAVVRALVRPAGPGRGDRGALLHRQGPAAPRVGATAFLARPVCRVMTTEGTLVDHRTLDPSQRAQLWIGGLDLAEPELLLESMDTLFEAPNWSRDGESLYVNGAGTLWRVDLGRPEAELAAVSFPDLPPINNDHVLDPDGHHIYLSAMDGHIYRGALEGGDVVRVTTDNDVWHFLHGVTPDGARLAYVRLADLSEAGRLAVMEPGGTSIVLDTGSGHLDGPEWSPDGAWIYVNTESFTSAPGHAQLGRIPDGGGVVERLVESSTVDWFPHLSPDGRFATYIAFPAGTMGHPPDVDVEVRLVATSDWSTPLRSHRLFGGQGTINVNSWSPDSRRFAFVAYPVARPGHS